MLFTQVVLLSQVLQIYYIYFHILAKGKGGPKVPVNPLLSPFKKLTYNILVAKTGKYSLFETV